MLRVVRAVFFGAVVGLVLGVIARALMRLVAIGMTTELEFNRGASLAIVGLFVISGAGAGAARAFDLRTWQLGIVFLLTSAPLLITGTAFAVGEINDVLNRDLKTPWLVVLLALSGGILAAVLLTPYAGWRAARSRTPRRRI